MRVISGSARRTNLKTVPGESTRPTTDRIKETLFNMIQGELYDYLFLDLFSGSGAIGIEALSRGARRCYFVEQEKEAVACIRQNLDATHLGQKAVVMGAGCIGLVSLMALKARGVSEVYVVDIMDKRLEKAMELGATGVINGAKEDVIAKVRELTGGLGTDIVIETAGTQITTSQAIHIAKKGSTIVLVGYSKTGELTLPVSLALDKELTFKTVFRYRHIYPLAIDAVASGKVNLKGIVTDIFPLDEAQKAMDYSVNNKADIVKAVIQINPDAEA